MCPACAGRGEVSVGITTDVVEYGPEVEGYDWRGNIIRQRAAYPTKCTLNPAAYDKRAKCVWFLDEPYNLWGNAVCAVCHGTGECGSNATQLS